MDDKDVGGCLGVSVVVGIIAWLFFPKQLAALLVWILGTLLYIIVGGGICWGLVAGILWVIDKRKEKKAEECRKKREECRKQAAEERKRQEEGEQRRRQEEEERIKQRKAVIIAELCSSILLPDTCFLMDLGGVLGSSESLLANNFIFWFEAQCKKCSRKVTLHRHVYQEIQRLYNGEDREKSKKAQNAKKLIERWQKLGIVQTYPDLEDAEKSYYADDALLKYMGELLEQGETVRLLTNDLDLRIRARDRFEKLGKALPEDMLLSLDDILAKWPR